MFELTRWKNFAGRYKFPIIQTWSDTYQPFFAFSPDGKLYAMRLFDSIGIYNTKTHIELRKIVGMPPISIKSCVAMGQVGTEVYISLVQPGVGVVWNVNTGEMVRQLILELTLPTYCAFIQTPDKTYLAVNDFQYFKVFDAQTWELLHNVEFHHFKCSRYCVGAMIRGVPHVIHVVDAEIHIMDLISGRLVQEFGYRHHTDHITFCGIQRIEGKDRLISTCTGTVIGVDSIETGERLYYNNAQHSDGIQCAAMIEHEMQSYLVTGGQNRQLIIRGSDTWSKFQIIEVPSQPILMVKKNKQVFIFLKNGDCFMLFPAPLMQVPRLETLAMQATRVHYAPSQVPKFLRNKIYGSCCEQCGAHVLLCQCSSCRVENGDFVVKRSK